MSRLPSKRTAFIAALWAVFVMQISVPFTALAQEGGLLMKLRVAERFIRQTAFGPDDASNGTTYQARSDVSLSVTSQTRTEALSLDLGTGYSFADGPTTDGIEGSASDPTLAISYAQDAPSSSITLSVSANQTTLSERSLLDTASLTNGTLDSDFAELTQDGGIRQRLSFDGELTLRDDAPFGLSFGLKVDDYRYSGLPADSTLSDFTYAQLKAGARFDISPVLQANLGAHYATTQDASDTDFDRYGLDAGVVLTRPNGQITADLSVIDGDSGGQKHVAVTRSYTLENTTASFGLGVSQATTDKLVVTGSGSIKHTFADESPLGTLTASAARSLTRTSSDNEDIVTSASLATDYVLSPLAAVQLSSSFARSEDILLGTSVDLAQANLALNYALNPDWTATAGLGLQSRDPSDEAATTSTTLSIGVARTFEIRP